MLYQELDSTSGFVLWCYPVSDIPARLPVSVSTNVICWDSNIIETLLIHSVKSEKIATTCCPYFSRYSSIFIYLFIYIFHSNRTFSYSKVRKTASKTEMIVDKIFITAWELMKFRLHFPIFIKARARKLIQPNSNLHAITQIKKPSSIFRAIFCIKSMEISKYHVSKLKLSIVTNWRLILFHQKIGFI